MLFAAIPSWAPFALGVVILTVILLKRSHRYYRGKNKRRKKTISTSKPVSMQSTNDRPLADAPREILRWQVEMHETARDLKAELDGKIVALGILLRDAQRETQRLQAAVTRAQQLGITTEKNPLDEVGEFAGEINPCDETSRSTNFAPDQRIYDLADHGHSAIAIANKLESPLGDIELALSLRSDT